MGNNSIFSHVEENLGTRLGTVCIVSRRDGIKSSICQNPKITSGINLKMCKNVDVFSVCYVHVHAHDVHYMCMYVSFTLNAVCQLNRMRRTPCGAAAASSRVSPWTTPVSPGVTVATDSSGYRILSLDGGGIRGLIQIEVLSELERLTGRRIREMFDCIIGTSTGGIIALTTVYCEYMQHVHVCMGSMYMYIYTCL